MLKTELRRIALTRTTREAESRPRSNTSSRKVSRRTGVSSHGGPSQSLSSTVRRVYLQLRPSTKVAKVRSNNILCLFLLKIFSLSTSSVVRSSSLFFQTHLATNQCPSSLALPLLLPSLPIPWLLPLLPPLLPPLLLQPQALPTL